MGSLWNLLLVFVGGGSGALLRYGAGSLIQGQVGGRFPIGTLSVNAIGCLLIGVAGVAMMGPTTGIGEGGSAPAREAWRLALVVGFLGGFTTFSAFSWESLALVDARRYATAGAYVLLTNGLCLGLAVVGYRLGERMLGP